MIQVHRIGLLGAKQIELKDGDIEEIIFSVINKRRIFAIIILILSIYLLMKGYIALFTLVGGGGSGILIAMKRPCKVKITNYRIIYKNKSIMLNEISNITTSDERKLDKGSSRFTDKGSINVLISTNNGKVHKIRFKCNSDGEVLYIDEFLSSIKPILNR